MYVERLKKDFKILNHNFFISHGGIHGLCEETGEEIKENSFEAIKLSI